MTSASPEHQDPFVRRFDPTVLLLGIIRDAHKKPFYCSIIYSGETQQTS